MVTIAETIFEVVKPKSWLEEEKYQFDWSQLKIEENPFSNLIFNRIYLLQGLIMEVRNLFTGG